MAEHAEGPRVIRGKGSWLEIGRQYGEELRAEIAHASRAIEELAMAAGHDRMSLKARINDYIPYAQKLPARWDELVGVAQGSCLAIEDVLLMQMLEDLLDVDACTTAGRAGFLLHAEMWFASHTDYACREPGQRRVAAPPPGTGPPQDHPAARRESAAPPRSGGRPRPAPRRSSQPRRNPLVTGPGPRIQLPVSDVTELIELLQFIDDWLATCHGHLREPFARFVGHPAYGISHLRGYLQRLAFLLGADKRRPALRRS